MKGLCCRGLETHLSDSGERGVYVKRVASRESDSATWFLYFRSADIHHAHELNTNFPVTLETRIPVAYCPFCGTNLNDVDEAGVEAINVLRDRGLYHEGSL